MTVMGPSISALVEQSRRTTADLYYPVGPEAISAALQDEACSKRLKRATKIRREYQPIDLAQQKLAERNIIEQQTSQSNAIGMSFIHLFIFKLIQLTVLSI